MKLLKAFFAWLADAACGHHYEILREYSADTREIGCVKCGKRWAMNDRVGVFVPWDDDIENLFIDFCRKHGNKS